MRYQALSFTNEFLEIFEKVNHTVVFNAVSNINEYIKLAQSSSYDVLMIVESDGKELELLDALRESRDRINSPVVVVARDCSAEKKVQYLKFPIDECLDEKMHEMEFEARIVSKIEKSRSKSQTIYKLGNLSLDLISRRATLNSKQLDLTRKEFKILQFLAQNKHQVVKREELMQFAWDRTNISERTLDTHLCNIRKKLDGFNYEINTIRDVGLRLHTR